MGSPAHARTRGNAATSALAIYLNDHLLGATGGVELSRRMAKTQSGSGHGHGEVLETLASEIAQDRESLIRLMRRLGVPVRRYKIYLGWVGEKAGRLKPNGRLVRRAGLSTVVELEAMRLGVEAKCLLWRTLLAVADQDPRLDADELEELRDRAQRQIDTLESLRLDATSAALSPELRMAEAVS